MNVHVIILIGKALNSPWFDLAWLSSILTENQIHPSLSQPQNLTSRWSESAGLIDRHCSSDDRRILVYLDHLVHFTSHLSFAVLCPGLCKMWSASSSRTEFADTPMQNNVVLRTLLIHITCFPSKQQHSCQGMTRQRFGEQLFVDQMR